MKNLIGILYVHMEQGELVSRGSNEPVKSLFQDEVLCIWDLDPYLPCIFLAAFLWHKAFSDCQLADGHCRDLRGVGANAGCIDWLLNA